MIRPLLALLLVLPAGWAYGREIRNKVEGSSSSWVTIKDHHYKSGIVTPCKGMTIPYEASRKARGIQFSCAGDISNFTRFPEGFSKYPEWNKLTRMGDIESRALAQGLRQEESNVSWSGEFRYKTYVSWSWTERIRGQNGGECDYDYFPHTCSRPKTRTVCKTVDDSPGLTPGGGFSPPGGSSSPSGGGSRPGGGGGYEQRRSPYGKAPAEKTHLARQVGEKVLDLVVSPAHARQVCEDVPDGLEYYTCYDQIARTCEWETARSRTAYCQDQSVKYTASYAKPAKDWAPGKDDKYLDILPNKYDLLPGEFEKIRFGINVSGGSTQIRADTQIDNAWNNYEISYSPSQFLRCEYGLNQEIAMSVKTVQRIIRKGPNALAIPIDRNGKPKKPIYFNELAVGSELLPTRPYEVRLVDQSAVVVAEAARQSRAFGNKIVGEGTTESTVTNNAKVATVAQQGFWKDTQFRIRMLEIKSPTSSRQITDDILTNGSVVTVTKDEIKVPLEGDLGLANLYHPIGRPLLFGWLFGDSKLDQIDLIPGKKYEIRISMYQRGIPFYLSGCKNGAQACEGEVVNREAFSDEMVMAFEAHEKVDIRSRWQKLVDWQAERNLWKKVKALWQ